MWNDLMRRWMELAFWWVPGQKDSDSASRGSAPEAPARQPEPAPEPEPESASAPTARPEPEPTPQASATTASDAAGIDLTDIKGIGPAMAKRLEKLGISSVLELADADAASLTEQLKADGAVVSEAKVAGWIEAARG